MRSSPSEWRIAPEGFTLTNDGRIFTPFWREPVVFRPSALGGANWPPSSYDPESQTLYVCANDQIQSLSYTNEVNNENPEPGERRIGGALNSRVPLPRTGILAAMDMTTNRLVWQQQWADMCYSGSAVTASGLLFIGRDDGRFTALDASDGSRLWEFQTGAGVNAPPAVFEHEGTQYVVVYSAGNLFARSPKGDSVWLFSLDGTLEAADPAAVAGVATEGQETAGATATRSPDPALGRLVYTQTCIFCHGAGGTGGHDGPSLTAATNPDAVRRILRDGRNGMPSFINLLSGTEIEDVTTYVVSELPR